MTDRGTLRVLVAEDEPAMLSLVSRHLRSLGFQVIEASEGDGAWELAQEHQPDLVILDVMMPGMSGWEICKRLKSHGSNGGQFSSTGVIMLTGIGENLNEMTSPLFAADAWLNKPFEFTELDARIRETLGRYDKSLPTGSESASDDDGETEDDGPPVARAARAPSAPPPPGRAAEPSTAGRRRATAAPESGRRPAAKTKKAAPKAKAKAKAAPKASAKKKKATKAKAAPAKAAKRGAAKKKAAPAKRKPAKKAPKARKKRR
jgi:CheY-like chemotaxis protein